MEDADALDSAGSGGGIRFGWADGGRNSGIGSSGIECGEIIDGTDRRNLLNGTGLRLRGVAMEPRGIGMVGLLSDRTGSLEASSGGFAVRKCRDVDGLAAILWTDFDSPSESDTVWKSEDLRMSDPLIVSDVRHALP